MKLTEFRITNFRSIFDTNPVKVDDITCLVGKNEAGKSAILHGLYRLFPIDDKEATYNVTDDYPRTEAKDYKLDVAEEKREPAKVAEAHYEFDDKDNEYFEEHLGKGAFKRKTVILKRGYPKVPTDKPTLYFTISTNEESILAHLISQESLTAELAEKLKAIKTVPEVLATLGGAEQTQPVAALTKLFNEIKAKDDLDQWLFEKHVRPRIPRFMYFDEYYQLKGRSNLNTLKTRIDQGKLLDSDKPLMGLINTAKLTMDEMINPKRTRELKNSLEAATAQLSKTIIKYWSQNKYIQLRFDVRDGKPEDPEGMQSGPNIWGEVYNIKHGATTDMETRSRGFVWFFSFLAWYSDVKRKGIPVILLLDEPGLSLHGKAQGDLLRYFEEEIKGVHQLVFTTHSPFMVDPTAFKKVRIVQDLSVEGEENLPREKEGTKVITEVLEATKDSLFPLQGALGYDICQTLFIGPNSLLIEGVSDLVYLQVMSSILEDKGRTGLDADWTLTPVGGSDKVPTFVSLMNSQKSLKVAVLIDLQKQDEQMIQNLYKRRLLSQKRVMTFADFTKTAEADIEDMFDPQFYLQLVNEEFKKELSKPIALTDLTFNSPRILRKLEAYLETNPLKSKRGLNHFRPSRYLSENVSKLSDKIDDATLERFEACFKTLNKLIKKDSD